MSPRNDDMAATRNDDFHQRTAASQKPGEECAAIAHHTSVVPSYHHHQHNISNILSLFKRRENTGEGWMDGWRQPELSLFINTGTNVNS